MLIEQRTNIPTPVLCGETSIYSINIAARMRWAANRETTRGEDIAYSLLGLFDVHMPLLYGEGRIKAFIRLQKEIIQRSTDETIFAWSTNRPGLCGFLAESPDWFIDCRGMRDLHAKSTSPWQMSNKGLQLALYMDSCHNQTTSSEVSSFYRTYLTCTRRNTRICPSFKVVYLGDEKYERFGELELQPFSPQLQRRSIFVSMEAPNLATTLPWINFNWTGFAYPLVAVPLMPSFNWQIREASLSTTPLLSSELGDCYIAAMGLHRSYYYGEQKEKICVVSIGIRFNQEQGVWECRCSIDLDDVKYPEWSTPDVFQSERGTKRIYHKALSVEVQVGRAYGQSEDRGIDVEIVIQHMDNPLQPIDIPTGQVIWQVQDIRRDKGYALVSQGEYKCTVQILLQTFEQCRIILGREHDSTVACMYMLGMMLYRQLECSDIDEINWQISILRHTLGFYNGEMAKDLTSMVEILGFLIQRINLGNIEPSEFFGLHHLSNAEVTEKEAAIWGRALSKNLDVSVLDKARRSPLSYAAEKGSEDGVRMLLQAGADPSASDSFGRSPFTYAIEMDHSHVAKLLVEHEVETDSGDTGSGDTKYGLVLLSKAAKDGDNTSIRMLIRYGVEVDSNDGHSRTPLAWAARNGHDDAVKLLVEAGAEVNLKDDYCKTPLILAAENGHCGTIRLLVEAGAEVDIKDSSNRTPLSWAARNGHNEAFKLLVEAGAEVNLKDSAGKTPFILAAANGNCGTVQLLIETGIEVNINDSSHRTALSWAAEKGHSDVVELLVVAGADANLQDHDGQTSLFYAAEKGHSDIVKLLIGTDAKVNSIGYWGQTPLSQAARNGHKDTVELLIEALAKDDLMDAISWVPLSWAARHGHRDVVKLLIDALAEANLMDTMGCVPLSWAARNGHRDVVKLLIGAIAKVHLTGAMGRTALSWAAKNGHDDVFELLVEAGANVNSQDLDGRTPLLSVVEDGHNKDAVELLIGANAAVDIKDGNDQTPHLRGARNGLDDAVKLQVEAGAGPPHRSELIWLG
jgi:ankyrin repeat protein